MAHINSTVRELAKKVQAGNYLGVGFVYNEVENGTYEFGLSHPNSICFYRLSSCKRDDGVDMIRFDIVPNEKRYPEGKAVSLYFYGDMSFSSILDRMQGARSCFDALVPTEVWKRW